MGKALSPVYATKVVNGKSPRSIPPAGGVLRRPLRNLLKKYALFYGKKPENPEIAFEVESFKPKNSR
jgi:CRISPR/Cas system endoribonuclease Cas6 (RAMP superfamily)